MPVCLWRGLGASGHGRGNLFPVASATTPFAIGGTGISGKLSQHFCGVIGEYGADSSFPGAQFASFVDDSGNPIPGAPALVPWLNQGTANFVGFTLANTQSPSSPALTVTAMIAYAGTGSYASYNSSTGLVTFTLSTNPGFIPGSEFTVASMSPSGFNQTYVAVAGTLGTTVVGNPLTGPLGTPQANNPGASTGSGGSLVSVIMPNTQVLGTSGNTVIDPYGTFGGTGTGGVGTYGLTANQATFTFTGSISGTTLTLTSTPAPLLAPGQSLTSSTGGGFSATHIVALLTGAGPSGSTYQVDVSQTATAGTITAAGALFSSGTPGTLFAAPIFYQTLAPSASLPGTVTARTEAVVGDFINNIGGSTSATLPNNHSNWGGSLANVAMLWGQFPTTTGNVPSTTALASLCKKTTGIQAFASANGLTVHSLYRLNDLGIWADSSAAQFTGTITGASWAAQRRSTYPRPSRARQRHCRTRRPSQASASRAVHRLAQRPLPDLDRRIPCLLAQGPQPIWRQPR